MEKIILEKAGISKILVMKPRAIGDVLLSTPVLPNLHDAFPGATIDFLVERFASPVLDNNPFLNKVIEYDARTDSPIKLIMRLRKEKYDITFDLFSNPRTAILSMTSGARYRVGYPFKWRKYAYNIRVIPRGDRVHNVEFNLDALRRIGIEPTHKKPIFVLDDRSKNFASNFLQTQSLSSHGFVTVNIGGGWEIKRWKSDKIVELCKLIAKGLNLPVVVLYGPAESAEAGLISKLAGAFLAPPTSLHQMGAIMEQSLLLVTNDSGPMHIAAALNVPTAAIFGPTSPHLQGPYGNTSEIIRKESLDCLECNLIKCPIGNPCMTELEARTVYERVEKLITKIPQGVRRADGII